MKKHIGVVLLILFGSLTWSLTMVKSGLVYSYGIGFWGPNGHDGIWHIALINQLRNFSLENPVFSGEIIKNYHIGFDLLAAMISRLTGIPPINLYFQVLPPIFALTTGWLTYILVKRLTNNYLSGISAVFFIYFGGSWGWLVNWWRSGQLGGESMFWANQAISSLVNPPYALSIIVLLGGLICLTILVDGRSVRHLLLTATLFGSLFLIKVYAGVIVSLALVLWWIIALRYRPAKLTGLTKLVMVTGIIGLIFFGLLNRSSASLLVLSPLWFPHTMLVFTDRLDWFRLDQAREAYFQSHAWLKWLIAEGVGLIIFIFGNLGSRIAGLFSLKKISRIKPIGLFLLLMGVISLLLPLLYIQIGNPWNTIQFFYYFQFLMAIFAGMAIGNFLTKPGQTNFTKVARIALVVITVLMTLPTTLITLKNDYLPGRPPTAVGLTELDTLKFLKDQPWGVVLSPVYNPNIKNNYLEPKPLYAYETTAYITAFTGKPSYLADEMNLIISGYNWPTRREKTVSFFTTDDQAWAKSFLSDNLIKYIYLEKGEVTNLDLGVLGASRIWDNGYQQIYNVN